MNDPQITTSLRVSGTLVCKDKQGNVLKTIDFAGNVPLEAAGITREQAQQIIEGEANGNLCQ